MVLRFPESRKKLIALAKALAIKLISQSQGWIGILPYFNVVSYGYDYICQLPEPRCLNPQDEEAMKR